jgi:hypothetical protein
MQEIFPSHQARGWTDAGKEDRRHEPLGLPDQLLVLPGRLLVLLLAGGRLIGSRGGGEEIDGKHSHEVYHFSSLLTYPHIFPRDFLLLISISV